MIYDRKGDKQMFKLYTTGELAKRWNKSRDTINYYLRVGKIKASITVQGRSFFTEEDIVNFEHQNNKSLPTSIAA